MVLVLLLLPGCLLALPDCLPGCTCTSPAAPAVECGAGAGLRTVPGTLHPLVATLIINHNNIRSVPAFNATLLN